MKIFSFLHIFALFCVLTGCSSDAGNEKRNRSEKTSAPSPATQGDPGDPPGKIEHRERNSKAGGKVTKAACLSSDTGDKFPLKSQTYPIDFEPFRNSCFVTFHNPENTDPPIGSEIGIFKNGQRIYKFDTRYHSDAGTCWIESVSFQDLNADKLVDIIVVGKCGAKSGDMQGNEVFINTGRAFHTSVATNDKLEQFKTIKDVAEFVKKNQTEFTPKR